MTEEVSTVDLDSLVGEHILDGVDLSTERVKNYGDEFEDANVIRFRLDGKVYTAIEDPSDGYRSSLDRVFVEDCAIPAFPPIRVIGVKKPDDRHGYVNDALQLIDVVTGKVVVEAGTENTDDYYPSFVSAFHPENMATNADRPAHTELLVRIWVAVRPPNAMEANSSKAAVSQ